MACFLCTESRKKEVADITLVVWVFLACVVLGMLLLFVKGSAHWFCVGQIFRSTLSSAGSPGPADVWPRGL